MLACKYDSRGSEFIREGAGIFTTSASSEMPPSRINSVPLDRCELKIGVNSLPKVLAPRRLANKKPGNCRVFF